MIWTRVAFAFSCVVRITICRTAAAVIPSVGGPPADPRNRNDDGVIDRLYDDGDDGVRPPRSVTPAAAAAAAAKTKYSKVRRLLDGFFFHRPDAAASRVRVTNLPRDGHETTTAVPVTALDAASVVFPTEQECESVNGRRPCVCFVPDFLDAQLDEASAGTAECPSYKAVPQAFVVSRMSRGVAAKWVAAADVENTTADTADETTTPTTTAVAVDETTTTAADETTTVTTVSDATTTVTTTTVPDTTTTLTTAPDTTTVTAAADETATAAEGSKAMWIPVDFDQVVRYQADKSNDGHRAVHYGLTGNDMKVKCLVNGGEGGDNVKSDTFKWDYVKNKHSTNSTVTVTSTGTLLISSLDPADSKNYTCSVPNEDVKKKEINYVHDVFAVERPLYEIRGKAFYTNSHGGCTSDIVTPFREQLPDSMREAICPRDEDQLRYACNVTVDTLQCSQDKEVSEWSPDRRMGFPFRVGPFSNKTTPFPYPPDISLEIDYLVTLNYDSNFLTLARASKNGRNAVYNQKMLARTSAVLAANLKKLLTVKIRSKYSAIDSLFEPENGGTRLEQFVACTPGFGIRDIFCAACLPHYYSPDRSAECLKCPSGFHQPIAGSEKCVKCPNVFASGCEVMKTIKPTIYIMVILAFLLICAALVASCLYCHRESNAKGNTKKMPKIISSSFGKLKKKYSKLSTSKAADGHSSGGDGSLRRSYEKIKKFTSHVGKEIKKRYSSWSSDGGGESIVQKIKKFNNMRKNKSEHKLYKKKWIHKTVTPKIPFENLHGEIGRHYENKVNLMKKAQSTPHQQH